MEGDLRIPSDGGAAAPEAHVYRRVDAGDRLHQGELLENVTEFVPARFEASKCVEVLPKSRPLAIVVTQDCDLETDWRKRQPANGGHLGQLSVLLCPAMEVTVEALAQHAPSKDFRRIFYNNKSERLHYLASAAREQDSAGIGHKPLLVDFRAVFSIEATELYRQVHASRRRFRLCTPWAEHLQVRLANYLCRVPLPLDHDVVSPPMPATVAATVGAKGSVTA